MNVGAIVSALKGGDLYRLTLRLDPSIIAPIRARLPEIVQAVTERLHAIGFSPVYLVTPDLSVPTGESFSVIARWGGRSSTAYEPAGVTITRTTPVEEPPLTLFREPEEIPDLDRDLSYEEQDAIRYALATDPNPKHLTGFAWTLEPDFVVSSSLLRAKARLAELRTSAAAVRPTDRAARDNQVRALLGRAYVEAGFRLGWDPLARLDDPVTWILSATKNVGGAIAEGLGRYEGVVESIGGQIPLRRMRDVEEAIQTSKIAPNAAALAVLFPIEVLATMPASAEIALARTLGEHAFADLHRFAGGDSIGEHAAAFVTAIADGAKTKRDVRTVLLDRMHKALGTIDAIATVKPAIVALLDAAPADFARSPSAIATSLGVTVPIAHAASSAIEELPGGLRVVRADVLRALDPANVAHVARPAGAMPETPMTGAGLKGPSTGALQLAYSLARPEGSNVLAPAVAQKRVALTNRAARIGNPEAKIAKDALEQARKILQRRKWIEWYKRIRKANG